MLQKLKLMIKHKIPYVLIILGLISYIRNLKDDGISANLIAKKHWLITYLYLVEFSNILGSIIRIYTYYNPQVVFKKQTQDFINTIVNAITRTGGIYWFISFWLSYVQDSLINFSQHTDPSLTENLSIQLSNCN